MATDKKMQKLEETEDAWETHAAADTFYDTTLAEFKAQVERSRDARQRVATLEQQLKAARNEVKDEDKIGLELEKNVALAIAGDKRYGVDSTLYEGTGRKRKSEYKTGLTRKKKTVETIA